MTLLQGTWTFYNVRRAFPGNHRDPKFSDEMVISLAADGGGTLGEFVVEWYDFNGTRPASPRVGVFSDGWHAFTESALPRIMAEHADEDLQIDELAALLVDAGFRDKTAGYLAPHLATQCPTCHGTGRAS